jgi:hypothetical protein
MVFKAFFKRKNKHDLIKKNSTQLQMINIYHHPTFV